MHQYLHVGSGVILHLARLDFAALYSLQYRVYEAAVALCCRAAGGLAIRNLSYHQRLVVQFLYLGAHLHHTAALPVVIVAHVYAAPCGEVGIEVKLLIVQVADGCVAKLVEVVR